VTRSEATVSPLDLSVKRRTEELERALIKEALERTRGNRTRAAKLLDLSVKRRTEELERALIKEALERTRGNRTRAAKLLDLSHRALLYKIRDYELGS